MSNPAPKITRSIAILGGFCLGLILAMVLSLAFLAFRTDLLKPLVENILSAKGVRAEIKGLRVDLDPLALTLEEFKTVSPGLSGLSLALDHLEARITPWSGLTKGAWLKTLTLTGPELEYVHSAPETVRTGAVKGDSGPALPKGIPDLTLLGLLPGLEELSLTEGRVTVRTGRGSLELSRISAGLKPEPGGPAGLVLRALAQCWDQAGREVFKSFITGQGEVRNSLDLLLNLALEQGRLDLVQAQGDVLVQARLLLDRRSLKVESLKASLTSLDFHPLEGAGWDGLDLDLEAKGRADLDGSGFALDLTRLKAGGLAEIAGRIGGSASGGLNGRVQGALPDPQRFLAGAAPLLPKETAGLKTEGPLAFWAELEEGRLRAELNPGGLSLAWSGEGVAAALSLAREGNSVALSGPLTGPRDLGGFLAGEGSLKGPEYSIGKFTVSLALAGTTGQPLAEDLLMEIGSGDWTYAGKPSPLGRIRLGGRAVFRDLTDPVLDIEGLELERLGRFKGQASLTKGRPALNLRNEKLDLAGLDKILALAGIQAQGWTFNGTAGVELGLTQGSPKPGLNLKIDLAQGGLSSVDGNFLAEKIRGGLELSLLPGKPHQARLKLDLAQGEALLKTTYLNLAENPLRLSVLSRMRGVFVDPVVEELKLSGEAGRFGSLAFKGGIKKEAGVWRYQGDLSLEGADLGQLFKTLIKGPLSITDPGLAGLDLSGTAGLKLRLTGRNDQVALKGRARVDRAGLSQKGKEGNPPLELVKDLSLDLPLSYHLGVRETAEPSPPQAEEWGRLKIGRIKTPFTELAGLDLALALKPNRLFFKGGVEADIYGGKIKLAGISVDRPLSRGFEARMNLDLSGLDLKYLGDEKMPLEGALHGRLEKIRLGLSGLRTEGRIRGTFYGGRVEVADLRADRPFSPGRTMGADVAYEKIHLERLSRALGIGRISGRISGRLDDLRVAYGQPVGFEMDLLSVPEKGVKQRVNLKAVNSISVLGTGAGLEGLGIKIMTKFFKDFPYKKIGIRCTLNNDVFKVRGLIREGGKEYLVRKPPLSGINVVNSNPDNRISFSDMRERLERVTGSEEGPTVK